MINLPVTYQDRACVIRKASRSGYFNIWPVPRGNALVTMVPADRIAAWYPEHADAILGIPDSTD